MLVLSRKKGESIQIAENISITVCEVRGGRVRLSIDAPKSVRVLRGEISFDEELVPAEAGVGGDTPALPGRPR